MNAQTKPRISGANLTPDQNHAGLLTNVLLDLRRRAMAVNDTEQIAMIDAGLQDDADAYARAVVGSAARLTRAQWRALGAIVRLTGRAQGLAPTLEELSRELQVSRSAVHGMLEALQKRGVVRRERYRSRSVIIATLADPLGSAARPPSARRASNDEISVRTKQFGAQPVACNAASDR